MLTSQEIFNKVATHLLRQGQRSSFYSVSRKATVCAYRGQGGLSCAVGCLIPDELYSPEFEHCQVRSLPFRVLEACGVDPAKYSEQLNLLAKLQTIHDNELPEEWSSHLGRLAQDLNLTMPQMAY